jgi:NADP-dependent 3-hydroxy acid dehydrogenase YdfG
MAIPPESIARAIGYAVAQLAAVEIDELVIPPTAQDF